MRAQRTSFQSHEWGRRMAAPPSSMAQKTESLLRVMTKTSVPFHLLLLVALGVVAWSLYAWAFKLIYGEIVLGLGDWGAGGGVTWGLYIGMFVWWVGIAHGGILVSASVRLFKVKSLAPVARLAELMALVALPLAVTGILMQLGRLDRVVTSILPMYPRAIQHSPLMWDVTVITLYFVLTGTYILLTLRHDFHVLQRRLPRLFSPLYRLLSLGYEPEEDEKIERMVWWLALGLITLAPLLLHGGVIPWLFALLPSMPGFYGAVMGPVFLSLAIVSAFGMVSVIAYIFRRVHKWHDILPDSVFAGLGLAILFSAVAALWLQLQLNVSGLYAPPLGVEKSTEAKLETPAYWLAIGLLAGPLLYLGLQRLFPRLFSAGGVAVAGVLVVIAVFVEKALFVVEGIMHPAFGLYEPGSYFPTWVEISGVVGTIFVVVLAFMVLVKVIPVVEVRVLEES